MHRPLETTFWMRFSRFIKGVFLYNTIYWKRASDDLQPKRMSREERASLRPVRDLNVIRPREKPRAAIELAKVVKPPANDWPEGKPPPFAPAPPPVAAPEEVVIPVEAPAPAGQATGPEVPEAAAEVEIRRRKRHRRSRHGKVIPSTFQDPEGGSFFSRLFK